MQALVATGDGGQPVRFRPDYPTPTPHSDEVLIRVRLAGICATDLEITLGYMQFTGVLGHEFVGDVVQGPDHLVGRRVVGAINCPCGQCPTCQAGAGNHCPTRSVLGIAQRDGAFAECLTLPQINCTIVPAGLTDEQAVFAEPLAAAVHVLDATKIGPGTRVTLLGPGRLGLLTAQVLAATGCELTVVGRSAATLARCRALGLNALADTDLQPRPDQDVVVECTGAPAGLRRALALCRPLGTIVLKSTYAHPEPVDLAPIVIHELNIVGSRCGSIPTALQQLQSGRVDVTRLIDATYPLADGVQALEHANRPGTLKILLRPGAA